MAKINLTQWIKENPNGTFEDWKEAIKKAGQSLSPLDEMAFGGRENYISNADSGTENAEGKKSIKDNKAVIKIDSEIDKLKKQPKTTETAFKIETVQNAAKEALKNMKGKTEEEQKKIVSDIFPDEQNEQNLKKKENTFEVSPEKKEETIKAIEQAARKQEIDEKSSSFLKSWASTHPTWLKILSSKDLSWGQKVALVGSALANIGANVTLGAKAGFEHGSFNGVPWDFKQAVDKYTENEIDKALTPEQEARGKTNAAAFWKKYREENGEEKTDELMALVDLYGDNPDVLAIRLKNIGINKSAKEAKELYANLEKTNLSESIKQKKLETESQIYDNFIKALMADERFKTNASVIKAKNAINDLQTTSATFDEKTYKLRKIGGMVKDVLETVEGAAATAGGVLTGGVVGKVKDGIIKAPGIPQKIVRADGSEIQLDPNDNIYATKNEITTEKDDGSDIVQMNQNDEVITLQKRLGYSGGFINKDFNYYLNKLRG